MWECKSIIEKRGDDAFDGSCGQPNLLSIHVLGTNCQVSPTSSGYPIVARTLSSHASSTYRAPLVNCIYLQLYTLIYCLDSCFESHCFCIHIPYSWRKPGFFRYKHPENFAMSLSRMSTELDSMIVDYLDGDVAALRALCGTSKYYQSIAAPLLYEKIKIENRIEDRVARLLLTLIDSARLAGYIKSFTLSHDEDTPEKIAIPNVQNIARKLRKSQSHIAISILRNYKKDFADLVERDGHPQLASFAIDAAVALILDMADNVETVCLGVNAAQLRNNSYLLSWAEYAFHIRKPSTKLKSIEIYKSMIDSKIQRPELDMFLYTSAQRIVLHRGHINYINPNFPDQWPLRSLELYDIAIKPSVLEDVVSTRAFSNLETLVLKELQCNSNAANWRSYDFQRLSDILGKHLRSLHTFTCTNHGWMSRHALRFRSFQSLSQLQNLRIDWNLLIDDGFTTKPDYEAMMPHHLHNLELANFRHHSLETWSRLKYGKLVRRLEIPDYTDVYMHSWNFITASSWSTLVSQTLTLGIRDPAPQPKIYSLLSEKTLDELRSVSRSAEARGLSFRVLQDLCGSTETRNLLDGPEILTG